jgi:putative Ca2+/H+ antiporter (TMEM165/GDT1 family)
MDWKSLVLAFTTVFLAEFGDKTQLLILSLAAKEGRFLATFLGAALALSLTSLIAAWLGSIVFKLLPPTWIRIIAGVFFIFFGVITLLSKNNF